MGVVERSEMTRGDATVTIIYKLLYYLSIQAKSGLLFRYADGVLTSIAIHKSVLISAKPVIACSYK